MCLSTVYSSLHSIYSTSYWLCACVCISLCVCVNVCALAHPAELSSFGRNGIFIRRVVFSYLVVSYGKDPNPESLCVCVCVRVG